MERVTANLFRKRVCVCVCVFSSPGSFSQNNKLSLQRPLGNWSHTESNKGCFSLWRWTLVPHPGLQEHVFYISLAIHSQLVILRKLRLFEDFFFMLLVLIFPVTFLIFSQTHSYLNDIFFIYDSRNDNKCPSLWRKQTQINWSENSMHPCDTHTYTHTHTHTHTYTEALKNRNFVICSCTFTQGCLRLFAVVMDVEIPKRVCFKSSGKKKKKKKKKTAFTGSPQWILLETFPLYVCLSCPWEPYNMKGWSQG